MGKRILLLVLVSFIVPLSAADKMVETNLHDFMEKYTKPAFKLYKFTGEEKYVRKILEAVPGWAIESQRGKWQSMVDKALKTGELKESCGACHRPYKKEYKNKYRKRPIMVSSELIRFLEGMK